MKQPLIPGLTTALTLTLANNLLGGGVLAADSSIIQTKNFIDTITGYTDLSTCAGDVLSTVVRAEYSGCGDSYAITSYTCFCTDSSSFMSSVISRDISTNCPESVAAVQAASALGVFDAYCALGVAAGLTDQEVRTTQAASSPSTTGSSASNPASPAATAGQAAATVTVTATPTGAASSSVNASGLTDTQVAIIIGVVVCVFGTGMFLVALFFWRKIHRATQSLRGWPVEDNGPRYPSDGARNFVYPPEGPTGNPPSQKIGEMSAVERPIPVELPDGRVDRGNYIVPSSGGSHQC